MNVQALTDRVRKREVTAEYLQGWLDGQEDEARISLDRKGRSVSVEPGPAEAENDWAMTPEGKVKDMTALADMTFQGASVRGLQKGSPVVGEQVPIRGPGTVNHKELLAAAKEFMSIEDPLTPWLGYHRYRGKVLVKSITSAVVTSFINHVYRRESGLYVGAGMILPGEVKVGVNVESNGEEEEACDPEFEVKDI